MAIKCMVLTVLVMINLNAMEQRADLALQRFNKIYSEFIEKDLHNTQKQATSLINVNRALIRGVRESVGVYMVAKRINELPEVDRKITQLQKTLVALRMIETHHSNCFIKKCGTLAKGSDLLGFMYTVLGIHAFQNKNYVGFTLCAPLVICAVIISNHCKKTAKAKQPIPTWQKICENEPLINGQKALTVDLESLTLNPAQEFADTLKIAAFASCGFQCMERGDLKTKHKKMNVRH